MATKSGSKKVSAKINAKKTSTKTVSKAKKEVIEAVDAIEDAVEATSDSIVAREALHDKEVNFFAKVIFHNLDYYTDFMCKLRSELADGNVRSFVGEEFSKDIVSQIKELIPGLLK